LKRQEDEDEDIGSYLKERRGYSHPKEEALDHTVWRAQFGRGTEPVVRETNK
jgi:hypothetical protein